MSNHPQALELTLEPADNQRLANLCGQFDEHLRQLERRLGVEINNRGNHFQVIGEEGSVTAAEDVLKKLYAVTKDDEISADQVHLFLQEASNQMDDKPLSGQSENADRLVISTPRGQIQGRSSTQRSYLENIQNHDINFGIGPAGTGKTYLAVACAIEALENEQVRRIVLVRPAVEAGERLGFLPGDLAQKIDPYLRPLYDALYEMMGFEHVERLIDKNIIEVAPLAYMRGRSLNESFIILDEAQNTTIEQMKMFLTRIGYGSKVIVTGDITQVDLPTGKKSGLIEAKGILKKINRIKFIYFSKDDVVRHKLVSSIIDAYEKKQKRK